MLVLNQSLFNREYNNFYKFSEGLGFNRFYVPSPYHFLIEDYPEMFYTIYKRNVLSIQCKKRLRWSNSMGEVQCQSIVFIDLYVPACLHQASIKLSPLEKNWSCLRT
jgi:hypothetical protein